MEPHKGKP